MAIVDILKTFNDEKVVVREGDKYVEKDKEGISLKGVLQRGRLKLAREKKPYPQGRSFRPSGITYSFCRRLKVLQLAEVVEIYDDRPTPKLQLVFDMGHAIHDIIQGYFWDIGLLKGSYYCLACKTRHDVLLAPTACPSCDAKRKYLKYEEINLEASEYLIKGRSDGILVIDGEEHIMDIKSIANRTLKTSEMQFCFEDLDTKGPKADHVVQLNLYMWMSGVYKGHLLYVAKNDHQIKSFAIPHDYSIIEPYLQEIKSLIAMAEKVKNNEKVALPPCCSDDKCICHTFTSNALIARSQSS